MKKIVFFIVIVMIVGIGYIILISRSDNPANNPAPINDTQSEASGLKGVGEQENVINNDMTSEELAEAEASYDPKAHLNDFDE